MKYDLGIEGCLFCPCEEARRSNLFFAQSLLRFVRIRSLSDARLLQSLLLILLASSVHAQSIPVDNIASAFNSFSQKNFQEKIYLHTDKDQYLAGEIVWFKVYNVGAASNTPLDFNKIAYAEILDNEQKPVMQARVGLNKGSGSGSLQLPGGLVSGTYTIRSYTSWMKNFSPDYYFEKPITIINTLSKPEKPRTSASKYDIQFFPEGGNLVEGLSSKIAFRAINEQGKGIDFDGAILDENNDTIRRIRPLKLGIGNFVLLPGAGKSYHALIKSPDGQMTRVALPQSLKSGAVMSVEETSGKVNISVQSNNPGSQEMFLLVHTRQETKIGEKLILNGDKAQFQFDKSILGDGVSHITLFNGPGRPLCERLIFKKPSQSLQFHIRPDAQQYGRRKKVSIELEAKVDGEALSATEASVSVYASSGLESPGLNIVNYLWLKSDLAGTVEEPESYFKDNGAAADMGLDNLMLTHGWRRFRWDDVLNNITPQPQYLPEIEGDIIAGKIIDTRTESPANSVVSYLSVPGKSLKLFGSVSDGQGNVQYYTKGIKGPSELVAQTNTMSDSTFRIELNSPFSQTYSSSHYPATALEPGMRDQILRESVATQVQNIYLGNKMRTFYSARPDSSSFYGKPDKVYFLDNFVRFNTMEEVLREYVIEVPINRQKDQFDVWVSYRAHYNDYYKFVQPLIALDGVPIFDPGTKIIRYDPKKVESIEVLTQNYYHGPLAFNSIINFKTYKGDLSGFQLDPRATVIDYDGVQLRREFYSPLYETPAQTADRLPDFRNVLYWSPDVAIDASGKKTISFYTSDERGKYTIAVQGITTSGKAGSEVLSFEVK